MNKDASIVFQVEFATDVTIGVTSYLVLVQDAVEKSIKPFKLLEGQKLSPVVLPQSDGQPAEFPLFVLNSELISVQVTKRVITFNLSYKASTFASKAATKFIAALTKELKGRLDEKARKEYSRFDVSFYRFIELKDDAEKVERANKFAGEVLNLSGEQEEVDAMQGFQSAYLARHDEWVSKKIFYAFAINNELRMHAIQLGVGAIIGNVGGNDFMTFERMMLEEPAIDAFIAYVENDIAEVIDERIESVSKSIQ